jgi:hypothetical protein
MQLKFDVSIRSFLSDKKEEVVLTQEDLNAIVEQAVMERYDTGDVAVVGMTVEKE